MDQPASGAHLLRFRARVRVRVTVTVRVRVGVRGRVRKAGTKRAARQAMAS